MGARSASRSALAGAALLGVLTPAYSHAAGTSAPCDVPTTASFARPQLVDPVRSGGEPVVQPVGAHTLVLAAHAGTTLLGKALTSSPASALGFAATYDAQVPVWRSADDGLHWTYSGLQGLPVGPHSPDSAGFSDPDLTIDPAGVVYGTEIDLANISVFSSHDEGASWPDANAISAVGDRPWLTAAGPGQLYLYVSSPQLLLHSADGGLTWSVVSTSLPIAGKIVADPLHKLLFAPLIGAGLASSADGGATWTAYPLRLGANRSAVANIAADPAGNVYEAHAAGYTGAGDRTDNGTVDFAAFDRARMAWTPPTPIAAPRGDALWSWVVAGRRDQAAVVWVQRASGTDDFYIYAAVTRDALGQSGCAPGARWQRPTFTVRRLTPKPFHVGSICVGTDCNLDPTSGGDRRLGDFVTATTDQSGRLIVAAGATATTPTDVVSHPIVVRQIGGNWR